MTDKKKIAQSIEVRISLPEKYEHVILTKYAEKEIEYDSPESMVEKESQLNEELVASLIRDMRALPERLGKKTEAVQEVEERIKSKLPSWLESEDVPNLANANMAKKTHERAVDAQQANKEIQEETINEAKEAMGESEEAEDVVDEIANDDELFEEFDQESETEDNSESKTQETDSTEEAQAEEAEAIAVAESTVNEDSISSGKSDSSGDLDEWDEDLFDNEDKKE